MSDGVTKLGVRIPITMCHGINTGMIEPIDGERNADVMDWDEVRELMGRGWHIGAHTVTHPNLSVLAEEDPSGDALRRELEECDAVLGQHLGVAPRDFAFTGTSWSRAAEEAVMERYRFGRLWIKGAVYQADGEEIRFADLLGLGGEDEDDGGPPLAARYITRHTPPYRLPSVEIQAPLIHDPRDFRAYLEGALGGESS